MTTDDERREVARRLRELPTDMYEVEELWEMKGLDTCCKDQTDYYLIHFALFGCFPVDHMHPCDYEELHTRLADLIEPSCDRDALLALEDEMFEDATGLAFISQLEKNEELQDLQSTMAKALMDYALASLWGCSSGGAEATAWPESAEFSTVETGAERFSWHDVGRFGWKVVVDHETGVQYLACMEYRYGAAVCHLLDADGTPLLVAEAGE